MDGSGQKEVFGRNKKLKRVTVLVTDGKGDGRRMLIFGTFSSWLPMGRETAGEC